MSRIVFSTVLLLTAFSSLARETATDFSVQATTYVDGILLESNRVDYDLELMIAGPDGIISRSRHGSRNPVFLAIDSFEHGQMTDGLYKYEIVPLPLISLTREAGADGQDPAVVGRLAPKTSRINGSFRIVDGAIVDPDAVEDDYAAQQGSIQ
jgi:hypothetical protein